MKTKINILVFIADDIAKEGIEDLLQTGCPVVVNYRLSNAQLLVNLKRINRKKEYSIYLVIRSTRKIDSNFIKKLKHQNVRYICTASTGTDHIDVHFAKKSGIKIINTPKANYISAAEHTFGLLLAIMKSIASADVVMKNYDFKPELFMSYEIQGKTLGIIGVGKVGSTVARYARAFNMNVLGNDIKKNLALKYPWIKFVSLKKLLQSSDIISIHTPLDSTTANLINKHNISFLKKHTILINTARGGIVQESALLYALQKRKIYYAAIDVFCNEPEFNKQFTKLNNVILTPHLAGKTTEARKRISIHLSQAIKKTFKHSYL